MEHHDWHAENFIAPLFLRAGPGRALSFPDVEGQVVELELLPVPSRAGSDLRTPTPSAPRTTPVPLARVTTRKMTREALAAVRAEDATPTAPGEEALDVRVVRLLSERGALTAAQAQQVRDAAARFKVTQVDALWRLALCDEDAVVSVLSELTRTPSMTARRVLEQIPGPEALSLISADVSRRARAVPLGLKGGAQLLVAMADPLDAEAVEALKRAIGDKSLVTFRAGPKALAQCRARLYGEALEPAPEQPQVSALAPPSELASRTVETLFRLCGPRGAQAQSLVTLTESLARLLGTAVDTPRAVAQALAAAALEKGRHPWEVLRVADLQDALGFGSEAEHFPEAYFAFPARMPDDGATRAVVVAFAFAAAAQDAKPSGARLVSALGSFKTRAQLPPELFDALTHAVS
jgi:hypothetical protein